MVWVFVRSFPHPHSPVLFHQGVFIRVTSIRVPQVVKDMVPMMWVPLEVREQVSSMSFRWFMSMPGMEAFSSATSILLGAQRMLAFPGNHEQNKLTH